VGGIKDGVLELFTMSLISVEHREYFSRANLSGYDCKLYL